MDYEGTDRYFSSWVVSCVHKRTRFYLTDDGLATDIPSRASLFRYESQAVTAANRAASDPQWFGFPWGPRSTAQDHAERS